MKKVGKIDVSEQAVTPTMLTSLFENMKDFVRSEIKSNNFSIRKEIDAAVDPLKSDIKQLQVAVLENRKDIKEIRIDMKGVKEEVKGVKEEVKGVKEEVKGMKEDMKGMEERLGNKIDKNAIRLDDHETRIASLEAVR